MFKEYFLIMNDKHKQINVLSLSFFGSNVKVESKAIEKERSTNHEFIKINVDSKVVSIR